MTTTGPSTHGFWSAPSDDDWDWLTGQFREAEAAHDEVVAEVYARTIALGGEDAKMDPRELALLWDAAMRLPEGAKDNLLLTLGWTYLRIRRENPIGMWVWIGALGLLGVTFLLRHLA
jgi:hypothetical protein